MMSPTPNPVPRYVLGTETEAMSFSTTGIDYLPAGSRHVVDLRSPIESDDALLAYAMCGRAVRAWPDEPIDSAAPGIPNKCAALIRA